MQLPCRRLRRPRRVLRQWPAASCSAAMASRLAVSLDRPRLGMPPRPPRPPRSPRQRRPRSRTATCPVVPRELSEGLAKPPRCRVRDVGLCRPSKQRRIPRSAPAAPQSAMANPCPNAGASPRRTPECASIPEAAPGRRWPAWPPRPSRRIPACRPVSRSVGAPADHAAQGRLESGATLPCGTKAAPPPRV